MTSLLDHHDVNDPSTGPSDMTESALSIQNSNELMVHASSSDVLQTTDGGQTGNLVDLFSQTVDSASVTHDEISKVDSVDAFTNADLLTFFLTTPEDSGGKESVESDSNVMPNANTDINAWENVATAAVEQSDLLVDFGISNALSGSSNHDLLDILGTGPAEEVAKVSTLDSGDVHSVMSGQGFDTLQESDPSVLAPSPSVVFGDDDPIQMTDDLVLLPGNASSKENSEFDSSLKVIEELNDIEEKAQDICRESAVGQSSASTDFDLLTDVNGKIEPLDLIMTNPLLQEQAESSSLSNVFSKENNLTDIGRNKSVEDVCGSSTAESQTADQNYELVSLLFDSTQPIVMPESTASCFDTAVSMSIDLLVNDQPDPCVPSTAAMGPISESELASEMSLHGDETDTTSISQISGLQHLEETEISVTIDSASTTTETFKNNPSVLTSHSLLDTSDVATVNTSDSSLFDLGISERRETVSQQPFSVPIHGNSLMNSCVDDSCSYGDASVDVEQTTDRNAVKETDKNQCFPEISCSEKEILLYIGSAVDSVVQQREISKVHSNEAFSTENLSVSAYQHEKTVNTSEKVYSTSHLSLSSYSTTDEDMMKKLPLQVRDSSLMDQNNVLLIDVQKVSEQTITTAETVKDDMSTTSKVAANEVTVSLQETFLSNTVSLTKTEVYSSKAVPGKEYSVSETAMVTSNVFQSSQKVEVKDPHIHIDANHSINHQTWENATGFASEVQIPIQAAPHVPVLAESDSDKEISNQNYLAEPNSLLGDCQEKSLSDLVVESSCESEKLIPGKTVNGDGASFIAENPDMLVDVGFANVDIAVTDLSAGAVTEVHLVQQSENSHLEENEINLKSKPLVALETSFVAVNPDTSSENHFPNTDLLPTSEFEGVLNLPSTTDFVSEEDESVNAAIDVVVIASQQTGVISAMELKLDHADGMIMSRDETDINFISSSNSKHKDNSHNAGTESFVLDHLTSTKKGQASSEATSDIPESAHPNSENEMTNLSCSAKENLLTGGSDDIRDSSDLIQEPSFELGLSSSSETFNKDDLLSIAESPKVFDDVQFEKEDGGTTESSSDAATVPSVAQQSAEFYHPTDFETNNRTYSDPSASVAINTSFVALKSDDTSSEIHSPNADLLQITEFVSDNHLQTVVSLVSEEDVNFTATKHVDMMELHQRFVIPTPELKPEHDDMKISKKTNESNLSVSSYDTKEETSKNTGKESLGLLPMSEFVGDDNLQTVVPHVSKEDETVTTGKNVDVTDSQNICDIPTLELKSDHVDDTVESRNANETNFSASSYYTNADASKGTSTESFVLDHEFSTNCVEENQVMNEAVPDMHESAGLSGDNQLAKQQCLVKGCVVADGDGKNISLQLSNEPSFELEVSCSDGTLHRDHSSLITENPDVFSDLGLAEGDVGITESSSAAVGEVSASQQFNSHPCFEELEIDKRLSLEPNSLVTLDPLVVTLNHGDTSSESHSPQTDFPQTSEYENGQYLQSVTVLCLEEDVNVNTTKDVDITKTNQINDVPTQELKLDIVDDVIVSISASEDNSSMSSSSSVRSNFEKTGTVSFESNDDTMVPNSSHENCDQADIMVSENNLYDTHSLLSQHGAKTNLDDEELHESRNHGEDIHATTEVTAVSATSVSEKRKSVEMDEELLYEPKSYSGLWLEPKETVSTDSEEGSCYDSDCINTSDLDTSDDVQENPPDNVSFLSLEFDDIPYSGGQPIPPPGTKQKSGSMLYTGTTPLLNTVPSTVFMDVDDLPDLQSTNRDMVDGTDVFTANAGFMSDTVKALLHDDQFMVSRTVAPLGSLVSMDSAWEELQHAETKFTALPVIMEESEPEDEVTCADDKLPQNENSTSLETHDMQHMEGPLELQVDKVIKHDSENTTNANTSFCKEVLSSCSETSGSEERSNLGDNEHEKESKNNEIFGTDSVPELDGLVILSSNTELEVTRKRSVPDDAFCDQSSVVEITNDTDGLITTKLSDDDASASYCDGRNTSSSTKDENSFAASGEVDEERVRSEMDKNIVAQIFSVESWSDELPKEVDNFVSANSEEKQDGIPEDSMVLSIKNHPVASLDDEDDVITHVNSGREESCLPSLPQSNTFSSTGSISMNDHALNIKNTEETKLSGITETPNERLLEVDFTCDDHLPTQAASSAAFAKSVDDAGLSESGLADQDKRPDLQKVEKQMSESSVSNIVVLQEDAHSIGATDPTVSLDSVDGMEPLPNKTNMAPQIDTQVEASHFSDGITLSSELLPIVNNVPIQPLSTAVGNNLLLKSATAENTLLEKEPEDAQICSFDPEDTFSIVAVPKVLAAVSTAGDARDLAENQIFKPLLNAPDEKPNNDIHSSKEDTSFKTFTTDQERFDQTDETILDTNLDEALFQSGSDYYEKNVTANGLNEVIDEAMQAQNCDDTKSTNLVMADNKMLHEKDNLNHQDIKLSGSSAIASSSTTSLTEISDETGKLMTTSSGDVTNKSSTATENTTISNELKQDSAVWTDAIGVELAMGQVSTQDVHEIDGESLSKANYSTDQTACDIPAASTKDVSHLANSADAKDALHPIRNVSSSEDQVQESNCQTEFLKLSESDVVPDQPHHLPVEYSEKMLSDTVQISSKPLKKLMLSPDATNISFDDDTPTSTTARKRYDTIGSIDLLTDSEDEDIESPFPNSDFPDTSATEIVESSSISNIDGSDIGPSLPSSRASSLRRRSLAPPSSLILSVALDEVNLQSPDNNNTMSTNQTNKETTNVPVDGKPSSFTDKYVAEDEQNIKSHQGKSSTTSDPPIVQPTVAPNAKGTVSWETVVIGNVDYKVDGAAIQNYKKVISHGGFYKEKCVIVEIFGKYLPEGSTENYIWILDNLFLYLVSTLELLVQDQEYVVVFFNGSVSKSRFPSTSWLKKSHQQIPRHLRKNLKEFYVVQSSFYFKTLSNFTRMFLSRKAFKKSRSVKTCQELKHYMPTDFLFIPEDIAGREK